MTENLGCLSVSKIISAPFCFHSFIYPGLGQIANQLRGNLTVCPNGRQLVSEPQHCKDSNRCLRNFYIQNCSSGNVLCSSESLQKLRCYSISSCKSGIESVQETISLGLFPWSTKLNSDVLSVTFGKLYKGILADPSTRQPINSISKVEQPSTYLFPAFNWFLLQHLLINNTHSLLLKSAFLHTIGTLHYVSIQKFLNDKYSINIWRSSDL